MFDKSDIRAAVEGGAISDEAAKRLEAFLKARNDPDRMLDPENLRFLANFNDVFLTIGIFVLMGGLTFLSAMTFVNILGLSGPFYPQTAEAQADLIGRVKWAVILSPLPVIAGAWLLAEYFCGKRRLLLPSMALALIVAWAAAVVAVGLFAPDLGSVGPIGGRRRFDVDFDPWRIVANISYAGFAASAIASGAIFWRFRLPFSLFLLAGSIAGLFYTAVAQMGGATQLFSGAAMLGIGIATLICAIGFDIRDPTRTTRNADHAFWLHMAAAPQIIFGVRGLVQGSGFAPASTTDATVMLIVLVAFGVISLALNRRALIVSGLVSFATALGVLVNSSGWGGLNALMLTALIVGGAIVLLGGGWRTARKAILRFFPSTGLTGRIFPPEPA